MSEKTNRAIVITGGGTGIGRAAARAFAANGDRVLITGRTKSTLDECAAGHGIEVLPISITDAGAPQAIADTAQRVLGGIDVLVNNAAAAGFTSMGELDEQEVRNQVETNLLAPILLTQAALPALKATRGTVVNIGSAGAIGVRAMPTSSVYAATKAGLDSLTRTWAMELGATGVRVVSLAPGLVNTGVGIRAGMPEAAYNAFLDGMQAQIPSGRVGTPDEIAWWILQLTDPKASYAHGCLVVIDGGLSVT
jgi:nogalaviketone/aklaviketone reductase